jgi:DNA polymerase-1
MKTTLLLDADVPAYRFACKGAVTFDWDDVEGEHVESPSLEYATDNMLQHINDLKDRLDAHRVVLCFSDKYRSANWRYDVLPSYKSNRTAKSKPKLYWKLEEILAEHFPFSRKPGLEGDDVLGILATNNRIIKGRKIIATIDKDLKTIPRRILKGSDNALLHLPKYGEGEVTEPTEQEADHYWMYQTLIGDTTDGYNGCPGIGPVKAKKALGEPEDGCIEVWWPIVVEVYKSKGLTEADALMQARVARICRAEDYDYRNKRALPWEPGRKSYGLT